MKRFALKAALFSAVVLGMIAGVYARHLRTVPWETSYNAAFADKLHLLATTPGRRFVAIGGSSVAFGIDSQLIGDRCGRYGVNMSVHAAFGLSLILSETEPLLREGDVVVVAPEYSLLTQWARPDPELLTILAERSPRLLFHADARDLQQVTDRGILLRAGRIFRREKDQEGDLSRIAPSIYYRGAFNDHGDLTSHLGRQASGPFGSPFTYLPGEAENAIKHLNEFYESCQRKRVVVYFSHPPFNRGTFEKSRRAIDLLEADLKKSLRIRMLDQPEETVFAAESFFDTAYHLTGESRTKRSIELAGRLAKQLPAHE